MQRERERERESWEIVNLDLWKMDWKEESWSIKKKEKKRKWRTNRLNRYTKPHGIYFWNSLLKTMGSDKIPSEYLKHSLFHLENERLTFHPATNWLNQVPKRYVLISHQRVFPGRGSWKFEIERRMPAEMSNAWKGKFWIGNMNFLPIVRSIRLVKIEYFF